jgi:hypothetical protein
MVLARAFERGMTASERRPDLEPMLRNRVSGLLVGWAGYEADSVDVVNPAGSPVVTDWDRGPSQAILPTPAMRPGPGEGLRLVVQVQLVAKSKDRHFWEEIGAVAFLAALFVQNNTSTIPVWNGSWDGVDVRWALVQSDGAIVQDGHDQGDAKDMDQVFQIAVQHIKTAEGIQ